MALVLDIHRLLPLAVAWAEQSERDGNKVGIPLTDAEKRTAETVGVMKCDQVRIALVDALPAPPDTELREAARQAGFVIADMAGITLGHSIFIRRGMKTLRLLSHELRHVYQYESYGSTKEFLFVYLGQILSSSYNNAPLEQDARAHEIIAQ